MSEIAAGEINRRMAVDIMGWQQWDKYNYWMVQYNGGWTPTPYLLKNWNPVEKIEHAWQVAERLQARYGCVEVTLGGEWAKASSEAGECVADTAPLAICLAALKAYGIDAMCEKSGMGIGMGQNTGENAST